VSGPYTEAPATPISDTLTAALTLSITASRFLVYFSIFDFQHEFTPTRFMSRTLAIGDVHGHIRALLALAELVPFREDDKLVFLGDYVDRGPDSKGVIQWLIERHKQGNTIALLGNHDQMMLEAPHDSMMLDMWVRCGGDATLRSYRVDKPITFDDLPDEHFEFLRSTCQLFHETESHIFVHAGVNPDRPLEQQDEDTLLWKKLRVARPHMSGKTVVCGHTAQSSGLPLDATHSICIDTWVYGNGWLTCLDVDSREFWQARSTGETRNSCLDEG
jgi:serine/threonine protein phosphatase 1